MTQRKFEAMTLVTQMRRNAWENFRNPYFSATVTVFLCLASTSISCRIIENAQFFILGHHGQTVESSQTQGPLRAPSPCF